MTVTVVLDVVAGTLLVAGATFAFAAAVGLLRFPDVLSRLHAGTKPQVLGMLLVLLGLAVRFRDPQVLGILGLAALFQLLTVPVSSHLIARAAYRSGDLRRDLLAVDELDPSDDPDDAADPLARGTS